MEITVCGNKREVAEGTTVLQILEAEGVEIPSTILVRSRDLQTLPPRAPGLPPQVMTLAVYDRIVMRRDIGTVLLKDNDEVECLYFEAGG